MGFNLGFCDEKAVSVELYVRDMDDPALPVKNGLVGAGDVNESGYAMLAAPVGEACPVCGSKRIEPYTTDYGCEWDDPSHYYYTLGCPDCGAEITETWEVAVPWAGEDPEYWGEEG